MSSIGYLLSPIRQKEKGTWYPVRHSGKDNCIRSNLQMFLKMFLADVPQNRFSYKFRNIHRKTPVLELFSYFAVNITKFLRTTLFIGHLWWQLLLHLMS